MWLCFCCSFWNALNCIFEVKPRGWGHVHQPLRFTFQFLAQLLKSFFMFSLQTKGKAFFVSINAVFSRAWLCSKGKQKQDLPKESPLLRVKPHQFLLIIRRRKCSPILFFQEYILKEEIILRNFYTSVELYLNSENLVCLRDNLIWQLSKHNMQGLFLHMRESYQNRIFLHKTFQVPGQKLTSVLCILSLIPKKNVYNL